MNNDKIIFHCVFINGNNLKVDFYSNGFLRREILDKRIYSNLDSNGNIAFDLDKIKQTIKGLSL